MFKALAQEEFQAADEHIREILAANIALAAQRRKTDPVVEIVETAAIERVGSTLRQWPEGVAAMPTELTRTSLFGLPADKPGARKMLDKVELNSRKDIKLFYTGKSLSAKDETAWLACLRLGRSVPLGQRIYMHKAELLRALELRNTGPNWKTLSDRLDRLSDAGFKVNFSRGNKTYSITMGLLKWGIENETGKMFIRLDPEGASLFENLAYQPWEVRLALKTDAAARILSYISGHEKGKPHHLPLQDLKSWCGYGGRPDKFRVIAMAALKELEGKSVLVAGSSKITHGDKGEEISWIRAN